MLNVWVLEYDCGTVLSSVELKSIWGLTDSGPNSILLADGDFPLMLHEDFDCVSQYQLWQQPQGIHTHREREHLVWQWEHHHCHQRLGSRSDGKVCFKTSWSFMCQSQVAGWDPDPLVRSHIDSRGQMLISEHRGSSAHQHAPQLGRDQGCGMGAETNIWKKCSSGSVSPFLPIYEKVRGCQRYLLCI